MFTLCNTAEHELTIELIELFKVGGSRVKPGTFLFLASYAT